MLNGSIHGDIIAPTALLFWLYYAQRLSGQEGLSA